MTLRFFLLLFFILNLSAEEQQPKDGIYQEKFDDGKLKYEISFIEGKKHGKEIFWYENGNKKMQSHFINGVEEGLWNQWHENGGKKLEVNYSNGKENGD